jgi:uncharacterized membrane protein YfcA
VLTVALVVLAVLLGALTRATFGFGEAVVSMPLLALLPVSLHTSASLVGLAGLTVALITVAGRLQEVDRPALLRLSVGTVLGIPCGVALLLLVPAATMSTILGAVLVAYGVYALLPTPRAGHPGLAWAYPTGLAAGALGSAYTFTGVPVVVYGTLRGWPPPVFRGSLKAVFLVSGVLVVAGQALGGVWTADLPWLFALCLPGIVLTTWAGHALHRRIPAHRFERYVYLLVVALGVVLTVRGALSM